MESKEPAIIVSNLSKTFKLPHEKNNSLKGALLSIHKKRSYETQKVLNDVSFEVQEGEFFGIVGRNGSGKSTLLKLLAGIYTPTQGSVTVNGKLTPFIELGVGFNPELTGRENVFLNGALLGFTRKEIAKMYDEIVAFAELEKFMDQKLKNYSSGMQVRLAFSIAIQAKSDILVLDEVLAVGDEAFQQKCIDVFEEYKAQKRTVVLVTHDMNAVRNFCTRAILINNGKLIKAGNPRVIADEYSRLNFESTEKDMQNKNDQNKSDIKLRTTDQEGKTRANFETGQEMRITMSWPKQLDGVKNAGIAIHKNSGEYIFGDNTLADKRQVTGNKVDYSVSLNLGPGKYHLVAGLFGETAKDVIDFMPIGPEFIVKPNSQEMVEGLVRLESEWKI